MESFVLPNMWLNFCLIMCMCDFKLASFHEHVYGPDAIIMICVKFKTVGKLYILLDYIIGYQGVTLNIIKHTKIS